MRDLAGFRDAVEQYYKRVGRTQKDLAAALYLTEGDLNKRLHDYSHQPSRRTWRLKPGHVKTIVETLVKWRAITARKQALALFALIDFPTLAEEIDWQVSPWNRLHLDAPQTERQLPLVRRRIFQARDLAEGYVPRPTVFNEIKRPLLTQEENQTTAITTALRGAGGFGKTTLATALCHDPEIQEAFPDGILWRELGEHPPGPLTILNEMLHVLETSEREALTLEEARQRWQKVLEERSYLLVIDDVWHTEALDELLKGGPRCGRLITTRNDQLLPKTAKRVWVDAMEPAEAMALLCQGVIDDWQHTLDRLVLEEVVIRQLGCWPLLVSLARGLLRRLKKAPEQALALLKHAYEERGMATFHLGDREERQRNVDACLEVNLRQLEEWVPPHYHARQRYLELAVFPEGTNIPLNTLQIYWQGTGGLHAWEVEDLCLCLADLSLLLPWDTEQQAIHLHDVLRSYLIQCAGEQLSILHERLLEAHHQHYHLARWADLPQREAYLWQHLVSHLCQVDNQEALQRTFTDLLYLTRTVVYRGVSALEADLVTATTSSNGEVVRKPSEHLALLYQCIRNFHHLLQQGSSEAEIGGLLLSALHEEASLLPQRQALKQVLPRPFLSTWHPWPRTASSALFRTLRGHANSVNACIFSPDGSRVVSASSDWTLKLWNITTGAELCTLSGHTDSVNACGFSPDGKWIVSASEDHTLKLWDSTTGEKHLTFRGHTGPVWSCGFSPDGKWIVSASKDHTLKLWDSTTGEEHLTFRGHTGPVWSCGFSPDGKWIVSGSKDHTLKLWDSTTGEEHLTFRGHTGFVWSCGFSPDGKWIVSGSVDGTLRIWEAATGIELRTIASDARWVTACAFSPDGKWIVSGGRRLKVWEAATGAELRTLSGHSGAVSACTFSPDGKWIVSASVDQTLKLWEAATEAELRTLSGHTNAIRACAFSPDGKWVVSTSYDFESPKIWDAVAGAEWRILSGHINAGNDCAVSPDGKWIVSTSESKALQVWDATTGKTYLALNGHTKPATACAFSPDGKWIVSGSYDNTLKIWEAVIGTEFCTLSGHTDSVWDCAFSPDGSRIVSASVDQTLKLWNSTTGAECLTLSGHTGTVNACIFSPDGSRVVSASSDWTLKLWNSTTGAELCTLSGHTDSVNACEFSSGGKWIISASADHTLKLWDAATGQQVLTFPVDTYLSDCVFHPDGTHLVACGAKGAYFLQLVQ